MKASTVFKCTVAITYGIFVGKALGLITEGFVRAVVDDWLDKEDKSESKIE